MCTDRLRQLSFLPVTWPNVYMIFKTVLKWSPNNPTNLKHVTTLPWDLSLIILPVSYQFGLPQGSGSARGVMQT